MICKLCEADSIEKIKIKRGYICKNCYESFPIAIKENIRNMTMNELIALNKVIKKRYSASWANCGNIGICLQSIQLGDYEINLGDIKRLYLDFRPKRQGKDKEHAFGTVTLFIELVNPQIRYEEPLFDTEVKYFISGKDLYISYPGNIQRMFTAINNNIKNGIFDTRNIMPKKKKEEKKDTEDDKDRGRDGARRRQQEQKAKSEFEEAKELFDVTMPFTKELISVKRKHLLKIHHPDMGGSLDMAEKINVAYELLMKYAD